MINTLLRPAPLKTGDKVALLAPSSPVTEKVLTTAIDSLRFLDLEPLVFPSCMLRHGYLAGSDRERALDLNTAFADDSIKGIFCLRGGYGAMRILTMLDYPLIKRHPKVFAGYSDITAFHLAFTQFCGFVTFHSPMPNTGYAQMDAFSIASLKANLFSNQPQRLIANPPDEPLLTVIGGKAEGCMTGGNLSLLAGTLGSPFEVDTRGKILFIEEVGELPYRLDRSLTALALAGKFEDCAGIVLGTFADCEESAETGGQTADNLTLRQIISEVIAPYDKPTLHNFRAGHIYPQSTIAMGRYVFLDAGAKTISYR